jgi:oxygen-independent coproporphyrinogen III oxidase
MSAQSVCDGPLSLPPSRDRRTDGAFPEVTPATIARYEQPGPRYTSYPTAPEWSGAFGPSEYGAKLVEAGRRRAQEPLSLYVHIPFCHRMCTFCGCNVVIARDAQRADAYITHLEREMRLVADLLGKRRRVSQLHLGGGTPTFLNLDQLARLWATLRQYFTPESDAELAVEVNPVFTTVSQLKLLAGLGFNRLSVGVQDFDPEVQQAINRGQTFEQTRDLVAAARELDFRGINIDLIYGLPRQRLDSWQRTLERVLEIRPDRVAVYSFAYVPKLRPHQRKLPPERPHGLEKLQLFGTAYDAFVRSGYRPIGMDHFALPNDELSVAQQRRTLWRNFQGYTVKAATDVIAFGITGISDLQGAYAQNTHSLPRYYEAVSSSRLATEKGITLSDDDRRRRTLITELMCHFCVDLGPDWLRYFAPEAEELRQLEHAGLLSLNGSKLTLTSLGQVFVRNVAMLFDSYLRRQRATACPSYSMTV